MWIVLSFNNKCLVVRHACNPSSWEAKAERSWIKGQLGLYRFRFSVAFSETSLQPNTDFKNGKREKKSQEFEGIIYGRAPGIMDTWGSRKNVVEKWASWFLEKSTSFASECHRSHEAAQNTCVLVFPDHRKEHSSTRDAEHATHSLVINPYVFASVSKLNMLM